MLILSHILRFWGEIHTDCFRFVPPLQYFTIFIKKQALPYLTLLALLSIASTR